ncbi:hypothetical protein B0H15DRAFT_294954 [Mycena belliarum]|uniref:DUF6534 domain-containing protein n=1 Tax=Mycena belliarum TaxID=1033014 RepID=A0AAD6U4V6_9AGAR|nr:hypothetical protein B0H15DRAFT_294954 [Mycena belliae]
MSAQLTGEERRLAMAWLGPWLVGASLDLLLQGGLFCQFVNYFTYCGDDMHSLRIVVAVLALLTTLKSIHAFAIVWVQSIVHFGDLQGAILLNYTAWWQSGNPLMVAIIGLYVQSFFCWRLWVISRKWYVMAPIAAVLVFGFISVVVATYFISMKDDPRIEQWFAAHLSAVFAGDMLISFSTTYFLIQSRREVLPQTVGLISALVRLTFQTAAPAAICAMFNLIFSQVNPGGPGLTSTAFNMALPKLYAISMMWTLNARRTIRASSGTQGMITTSGEMSVTGRRSRASRRQGDMELGGVQAIQVLKQTETTQHVDDLDLFDPKQRKSGTPSQADTKSEDDWVNEMK